MDAVCVGAASATTDSTDRSSQGQSVRMLREARPDHARSSGRTREQSSQVIRRMRMDKTGAVEQFYGRRESEDEVIVEISSLLVLAVLGLQTVESDAQKRRGLF